jgi:GTP pyrophosphokinase
MKKFYSRDRRSGYCCQRDHDRSLIEKLTNWQRRQWAKAGRPQDISSLKRFARLQRDGTESHDGAVHPSAMRQLTGSQPYCDAHEEPQPMKPGKPDHSLSIEVKWGRLAEAITYATPYIGHLLAVASLVLEHGGDEEQAMAGVLHDAIEDQGAHQEVIIAERFGTRVAAIVRGCTDADTTPKPPWRARKEAYLAHLETAEPDILLVSCADKLHNARSILTDLMTHGLAVFDRFRAGLFGTLWYYGALAEVFDRRFPGPLARELKITVNEIIAEVERVQRIECSGERLDPSPIP